MGVRPEHLVVGAGAGSGSGAGVGSGGRVARRRRLGWRRMSGWSKRWAASSWSTSQWTPHRSAQTRPFLRLVLTMRVVGVRETGWPRARSWPPRRGRRRFGGDAAERSSPGRGPGPVHGRPGGAVLLRPRHSPGHRPTGDRGCWALRFRGARDAGGWSDCGVLGAELPGCSRRRGWSDCGVLGAELPGCSRCRGVE